MNSIKFVAWVVVLVALVGGTSPGYAAQKNNPHRAIKAKVVTKKRQAAPVKKRVPVKARTIKTAVKKPIPRTRARVLLAQRGKLSARPYNKVKKNWRRMRPIRQARIIRPPRSSSYEPFVYASSVLVVDHQTGRPIYAKNPNFQTPIASITKLMTALVTLEANLPLGEYITITSEDVDRIKHTSSRLALGTQLTRLELLHLALIASENRAAAALSRAYPGGRRAFVAAMNRKARELGMAHTYFVDGTGLSSHNRSTAQDLVKLVQAAHRNPLIRSITTTASYEEGGLAFRNTNALVRRGDWNIGVSKTGFINEAGYCLVMQAQVAGRPVIMVLLHSRDKWSRIADAERIRKWLENGAMQRYVQLHETSTQEGGVALASSLSSAGAPLLVR